MLILFELIFLIDCLVKKLLSIAININYFYLKNYFINNLYEFNILIVFLLVRVDYHT